MSVAFRRESDDEHLEPKFELPIPPGPNLVTPRGFDLLKERVATLETELPALADEDARKKLQRDLRYWRARLASAQIAPEPSGDTVAIGTTVTIDQAGKTRTLTIVGHDEADPAASLISFASPLGRALMGAEEDEEVELSSTQPSVRIVSIAAR